MISWNTKKRGLYAAQNIQSFGREFCILDKISGETNEVGLLRIDRVDYRLQIATVALMVNVGDLDEPMAGLLA
ncbi:MAG TPA: hypothetical protein VM735_03110 [Candidatus Kapabacteria bacterium]|nr:hypothetical protein [Candidatus Kapabacteria bacterium]